jgi:threonine/homoserine/homoserine lactone efflux protein
VFEGLNWGAFLLAMFVVELTPGPNMGWLTTLSAQYGRAVGMRAVAGITLGLTVQMLLAATGVSTIIADQKWLYETLRWAGVAFMLYLAYEAWRDAGESSPSNAKPTGGFQRGLIANLLNPKALVFYIAVVGQFADAERGSLLGQILTLGSIHLLVAFTVHTGIVALSSNLGTAIERYKSSIITRLIMALALVLIAAWIAFTTAA